jgi:hypothetical protein
MAVTFTSGRSRKKRPRKRNDLVDPAPSLAAPAVGCSVKGHDSKKCCQNEGEQIFHCTDVCNMVMLQFREKAVDVCFFGYMGRAQEVHEMRQRTEAFYDFREKF